MTQSFKYYPQLDEMDCGPTCLRMILKHYGKNYPIHLLRKKTSLNRAGVSFLGISEAAESIGFRTISVRVPFEKLKAKAPVPCIVHWQHQHFVVVYKFSRKKVYVADPAVGKIAYSREEFINGWTGTVSSDRGFALLLEPTPSLHIEEKDFGDQKAPGYNLFPYIKQHRKVLTQLAMGFIAASLLQLAFPFLTQSIVDRGIHTQDRNFIYLVLVGQLFLFLSRMSIDLIKSWILLHLSTSINISIISGFLQKLFRLPLAFFEGKMIGDILRRIDDHERLEKFLSFSSLNILFSLFNLIVFGFVLAIYDHIILLVFIIFSVLYLSYLVAFMRKRARIDYNRFRSLSDNQTSLIQIVQGMTEIKMNGSQILKRWEWEKMQSKLFHVNVASMKVHQFQDAGALFINELKNIVITIMTALSVMDGKVTLGMMLAVQYIIGQLNTPLRDLISFMRDWQDAKIGLERINEVHALDNEEQEPSEEIASVRTLEHDSIKIENLSFRYVGTNSKFVLSNINLEIPSGKITAIVGASGSGKSTLMKLLLKFYVPTYGLIRVGANRLSTGGGHSGDISASSWRKHCGTVFQDGYIFADTVARNISLSELDIDMIRLENAAKLANCTDFIDSLPLGYNTKIGMSGLGLSQGQRQRLLIARAIYKDPNYIFLDEATSSLDANNETEIMNNLMHCFIGKTVVVIAHRLSTVKNADQIVVIDNGEIAEVGDHLTLAGLRGKYYQLVKNQLELESNI